MSATQTSVYPKEFSTILSEQNHLLARCLITEIHHITTMAANRELENSQTKYDQLITYVLRLHGDPAAVFLASLISAGAVGERAGSAVHLELL